MNKKILAIFLIVIFFCEVALIFGEIEEVPQKDSSIKEIKIINKLTQKVFGEKEVEKVSTVQSLTPIQYCNGKKCYWEALIVSEPCGGSQVCKNKGKGEAIFNYEKGFSNPRITSMKFDDNGEIYINKNSVFSKTFGCAVFSDNPINIERYLKLGENVVGADVNNSCGLSMSARVVIEYTKI